MNNGRNRNGLRPRDQQRLKGTLSKAGHRAGLAAASAGAQKVAKPAGVVHQTVVTFLMPDGGAETLIYKTVGNSSPGDKNEPR